MLRCAAQVFKVRGVAVEFFNETALFTGGLFPEWFSAEWESAWLNGKFQAAAAKADDFLSLPLNREPRPLIPITGLVSLGEKSAESEERFFSTAPFSMESANPVNKSEYKDDFSSIVKMFNEGLSQLARKYNKTGANSAQLYLGGLDALFILSFSNVAAADCVSLYTYAKIYAAFTAALYNSDRVLIIKGEFDGIQKFIFDEEQSSKNPSKILRGKSFYISLISEAAALAVCRAAGAAYAGAVINAAGLFVIIAEAGGEERLKEVKAAIHSWLYDKFYATVSFGLGWREVEQGENFSAVWRALSNKLELDKVSKFELKNRPAVFTDYLDRFKGNKVCPMCGKEPLESGKEMCALCGEYNNLGQMLASANSRKIAFYESSESGERNFFGLISYDMGEREDALLNLGIDLNRAFDADRITHYRCWIKAEQYQPLTFDELAERSRGASHLAVLKADVDNMGKIFALGLRKRRDVTIFHIAELSFRLHVFFTFILQQHAKDNDLNIYMVFAGGDDLCAVGSRDDIIKFTLLIAEKLGEYVKGGDITISGGIALFNPHTPVWFMADRAARTLLFAKDEKNRLALFEAAAGYDEFKEQRAELEELFIELGEAVSISFYYKLLDIAERWQSYKNDKDVKGLLWQAHLRYSLARMKLKDGERENALKRLSGMIEDKTELFKALISLKIYEERSKGG
jgi:CRISPR-associated protein Csm1